MGDIFTLHIAHDSVNINFRPAVFHADDRNDCPDIKGAEDHSAAVRPAAENNAIGIDIAGKRIRRKQGSIRLNRGSKGGVG